jgi:hypothetical protein
MALATEWQFQLQNKYTPPASLKPVLRFGEAVTAPVWTTNLSEERHSVIPLISAGKSKAQS